MEYPASVVTMGSTSGVMSLHDKVWRFDVRMKRYSHRIGFTSMGCSTNSRSMPTGQGDMRSAWTPAICF